MTRDHTTSADPRSVGATVDRMQIEHLREAIGIGSARPRLSWTVATTAPGWYQSAYAIEAYGPSGEQRGQTGRVESDQSVLVPWPFAPLSSRERCMVRVKVWDREGRASTWSEPAAVEAGLLEAKDWTARFVTPDWDEDTIPPTALSAAAPRVSPPRSGSKGTTVRDRAWRLRSADQRTYGRRPRARAGLDELPSPPALPDVRRHVAAARGSQRDWRHGRRWLVSRPAGFRRRHPQPAMAIDLHCSPRWKSSTRTARASVVDTDECWRAATGPILASRPLRRRDLRCPSREVRLVVARLRRP